MTAAGPEQADVAAGWLRRALLVAVALAFGGLYFRIFVAPALGGFSPPQAAPRAVSSTASLYRPQLLPNSAERSVHSATAAEIGRAHV